MNRIAFKSLLLFAGIFALAACNNDDDLPDEPVINSVEFLEAEKDLVINFTDGDGNFGLPDDMIDPPFQAWEDSTNGIINKNHNNLWVDVFVKESGAYARLETPNPYGFDFRIPFLTPAGQNKQLKVTATYDLVDLDDFISTGVLDVGDTMRFE
ncbi:MAG: hypothetical protein WBG42_12575, partial [Cryomorphaceae bacterium]